MMMMRPLGSLLLLTCGLLLSNQHANAVTELTDANFFDYAKDKDVLLVDFYAPWCSDCKALDPDFENAASNLGTRSVDLAKVDCFGAGKGLCSTYGVKQWPTLKNFNRGQYTGDYTGGLSTAEIAGYITTVENSVHPVVNPYAAPYTPQASAVVTQQCVAKCKISRISNKQPCYARCKPKSYGKKPILPQPVINEKSCAKCRQPAIAGKFSACCKRKRRKRIKRSNLRHGYSGLPIFKERMLLDNYMNKYLKDYIKGMKDPRGLGERKAMESYVQRAGEVVSDKRSTIRTQVNEKKRISIPKPVNDKRSSIPRAVNKKRSWIATPLNEKRSSIPTLMVDDESSSFQPRPVGEDFHIKVDQLRKK